MLKQIDFDGAYEYSDEVEISLDSFTEFSLEQNYPNPFNPVTTIKFSIPNTSEANFASSTNASLVVYNSLAQQVTILFDEQKISRSL
ncbi:MAG: hypothetical protein PVH88_24700 [Ignavibacteria bacterium]|jgi:hypothetical protein